MSKPKKVAIFALVAYLGLFAAMIFTVGLFNYALALAGEPRSVWLMGLFGISL